MARPIRVEFAGAVYHVMARGNERREIFRDGRDRHLFLETLAEVVPRFGVRLYAYCLMPNHHHLLLSTPRGNLSRAAGWLQATYTARFNARHRRSGHLFQGRFKAQLVEADEYARWLVEYVHLNPVRPRRKGELVAVDRFDELTAYEWSSHRDYAGLRRKSPEWLSLDWLRYWGRSKAEARRQYRQSMRHAFGHAVRNPWLQLRRSLVLGGDGFYKRIRTLVEEKKGGLEEARWTESEEAAQVQARVRKLVEAEPDKRIKIWARVRLGGERGAEVAREYGYRSGAGVTLALRRLETAAGLDKTLKKKLERARIDAHRK